MKFQYKRQNQKDDDWIIHTIVDNIDKHFKRTITKDKVQKQISDAMVKYRVKKSLKAYHNIHEERCVNTHGVISWRYLPDVITDVLSQKRSGVSITDITVDNRSSTSTNVWAIINAAETGDIPSDQWQCILCLH